MNTVHDPHSERNTRARHDLCLETIPAELKGLRQWVLFRLKPKPNGKRDKIPLNPHTGERAAVDDKTTWGTFEEAVAAYLKGRGHGLGFVFTASDPYVGVDLDGCRDPKTGQLTPWAWETVQLLNSYTEASLSGTGIHILSKAKLPGGGGKRGALEMYEAGRYFVMTGEHIGGTPTTIEDRQEQVAALYNEHFRRDERAWPHGGHRQANGHARRPPAPSVGGLTEGERERIRGALGTIPAVDYDVWLKIGMALHSADSGDHGVALWREWSATCSEKYDAAVCDAKWRSFTPREDGVTVGTLFAVAAAHGWTGNGQEAEWESDLLRMKNGRTLACPANIALILRNDPAYKGTLRYNLFTAQIEHGDPTTDAYGRVTDVTHWTDRDDAELASFLLTHYKMPVANLKHCADAVSQVAQDHSYDPITTWLDGLPQWDEVSRLETFFEDYCEAEKTAFNQHCGRSFFLAAVARAYTPGTQVDNTLVLQGAEGVKKTSLCRLLGGPWFRGITLGPESKDFYQKLGRTWIGELAELDSFRRSEQTRIKAMLTTIEDSYRPPYGRHEIDQRRRTVFIGTTNDPEFISDPHGGRRFLPITVGTINIDAVAAVLTQLFAEARDRYKQGETWWEESAQVQEEARARRDEVREVDPWEHKIDAYIAGGRVPEVTMSDIFGPRCLYVPVDKQTTGMQMRVGLILRRFGYKKIQRQEAGERGYLYVKK